MLMPVCSQRVLSITGGYRGIQYAPVCSHPGSSHRAFSPLGANEANEDLSEAVMFADLSKDGRQGGREREIFR